MTFYSIAIAGLLLAGTALAETRTTPILPGLQHDGSVLLPNQWSLRPVGKQIPVGDFPVQVVIHPRDQFAAVLHSGYGRHEVRIIDLKAGAILSQVEIPESFYGLAWSPTGDRLYVSGGGTGFVFFFQFKAGYLSDRQQFTVGPPAGPGSASATGTSGGMAVSGDGRFLYIADTIGQAVEGLRSSDGSVVWRHAFGASWADAQTTPESAREKASADENAAFPYTCLVDRKGRRIYVSLWAKSAIAVLDAADGREIERWTVGDHPNEMLLGADQKLYVAEANRNSVSVVDTGTGRVIETLVTSLYPQALPGSTPNSLALSKDEKTLFVSNATNNNVAVFDLSVRGKAQSLGFIPVGWYPTSVRISRDGKTLVVANGKGVTSAANPRGPFPGTPVPRNLQEYIGGLLQGTVSLVTLPTKKELAARLGEWTKVAYSCSPADETSSVRGKRPEGSPIPGRIGESSPIKHVIYVIRENRTYDQIFGDMKNGNGAAELCLFPEEVTPNAHALAREFVLFDNFFADGEVSADGHEWTMGAYATDFVEKMWPMSYGHGQSKKYDYPSEGRFPIAYPANGYLWNRAAEAGLSYRSYGEFCETPKHGPEQSRAALPILRGHIDPLYRAWDLRYPDVLRAKRFLEEVRRFEKEGAMPALQVVRLGNDHTEGTRAGARTPTAMVADNDAALGLLVEGITQSQFWPSTALFVLEDDAQNGPDHVDAHRMPVLCVSPWTKRHAVDSTLYSTTSVLRTMELILGLQPMSQFDAAAMPMWEAFQATPDFSPYAALPARVDVNAQNTKLAWGAEESRRMDFSGPDKADDIALNEIVWRSVKGATSSMPAPIRAAFFKAHPKDDDDDDRH